MGQVFHSGTFTVPGSGLQDPNTGQLLNIGTPEQVQNGIYQRGAINNQTQHPTLPGDTTQNPPVLRSQAVQPSLEQAASAGATPGGANAASPGLSKAGKLAVLLTSGLQGAIAGHAAQEQMSAQSGGRRSGGAGVGFQAGYELPWQRAQALGGLQQQAAQTELTKSQSQMVQTPYGMLPAALAKVILPAQLRGQLGEQEAQTRAGAQTQSAQISHRFMAVPGVGVVDTQGQGGPTVMPGTQNSVPITQENYRDLGVPAEFVGKNLPLAQAISAQNALRFSEQPVEGAADQYLVNRNPTSPDFGKKTALGVGIPALGRAVQIADPNSPGNTTYTTAANAIRTGAQGTASASLQVPRQAAKSEVPTNIGDQKVAFTTMIQHAELLRQAAKALQNGDVQTLNGLENAFKNEFGYSGPITAQAIADAYGGEVTNVISKGHITDAEAAKTGRTINPSKQNFDTVNSVLNAYQALAQSKMNMLNQQENSAISSSQKKTPANVDDLVKKYGGH